MTDRYDIVVIGAGVAGAACAAGLDAGRVLLVERSAWPREKVCGCCLNGAASAALRRLRVLERLGAVSELRRVTVRSGGRSASFARPAGVAVARSVLDAALVSAATERGVEFRPSTSAVVLGHEADEWRVRLTTGGVEREARAPVVIAADGIGGGSLDSVPGFGVRVARSAWFGVGGVVESDAVQTGEIAMHVGRGGYVGLVRLADGHVNMGAALDPVWVRQVCGPAAAVLDVLRSSGVSAVVRSVRGTGLLTRQRERVAADGLVVLGDAAGYVEPFTGEGMAWGLAGAEAVARLVNGGMRGAALGSAWSEWYRTNVRPRQWACRVVRTALRRPAFVAATLSAAEVVPAVARLASAVSAWMERPYDPGVAA